MITTVPAGDRRVVRFYNPTGPHPATPLAFREFGPLHRFDHQDPPSPPDDHPGRGIWYGAGFDQPPPHPVGAAAFDPIQMCAFECFGRTQLIDFAWMLAIPQVTSELHLLDLVDASAVAAGTFAQINATEDAAISQAWSRYFYEHPDDYGQIDGLRFRSAWSGGISIALYERAKPKLRPGRALSLREPSIRGHLLRFADDRGWAVTNLA